MKLVVSLISHFVASRFIAYQTLFAAFWETYKNLLFQALLL